MDLLVFTKKKDKNIKSGYHFSSKNINHKLENESFQF